jgi:hypothetical protein
MWKMLRNCTTFIVLIIRLMNRESSKRLYPYKEKNLPGSFSMEHAIKVVAICMVSFLLLQM